MRLVAGLTIALAAVLACAATAFAAPLPSQALTSPGQVLSWHGRSPDPTGQGYGPPTEQTCTASTCDSLLVRVDLPAGTFPLGARHPAPRDITRVNAEGPT